MKQYVAPELELVLFAADDVITSSTGVTTPGEDQWGEPIVS